MSRLTASCIWTSFQNSEKRHLLLTGSRGSGKTTLFQALGGNDFPGLTTTAEKGKRVLLRENGTGKEATIGRYDPDLPGMENKMTPIDAGFQDFGVPALRRCEKADSEWVSLDEIGYLEEAEPAYQEAVFRLMEKKHLLAVIRKQDTLFLKKLLSRDDVFVADLDRPFGNFGCVIMASGFGKRFGGNKLMESFHGKPMIQSVLEATETVFAERVVVTRYEDVVTLCREKGVTAVVHHFPDKNDTVRLGTEALGTVDGILFCPADQPKLRAETIQAMMLCVAQEPERIWRAASKERVGAPVYFPNWCREELKSLPKGEGGQLLLKRYAGKVRFFEVEDPYELMDVDTPKDKDFLETIE